MYQFPLFFSLVIVLKHTWDFTAGLRHLCSSTKDVGHCCYC